MNVTSDIARMCGIRNPFLHGSSFFDESWSCAGNWTTPPHRLVSCCCAGPTGFKVEFHGLISTLFETLGVVWELPPGIFPSCMPNRSKQSESFHVFSISSRSNDGSPRSPTPAVCGEPTEKAKEFIEQAASCHLSSKLRQRGTWRGRQFLKLFGMEANPYVCYGNVWWSIGHGTSCRYVLNGILNMLSQLLILVIIATMAWIVICQLPRFWRL